MNEPRACPQCLRRAWLLSRLGPYIEKFIGEIPGRDLTELFALSNESLCGTVTPASAEDVLAAVAAIEEPKLLAELAKGDCWATCCHEDSYPEALRGVSGAPPALIGRGQAGLLKRLRLTDTVTVVGARRATSYGREIARSLGYELATADAIVLSGLAFGVDACAHRGALEVGMTVAVMGCGPDVVFPAAHRSLHRRVSETGLVLSELPPGSPAWRWTMPARGRIMAALGGMTVVIEAAEKSGSLGVAWQALELGRPLGAVPGPVNLPCSSGSNALLVGGAHLIRDGADVTRVLREAGA